MVTIKFKGPRAVVEGELSKSDDLLLQSEFAYVNPLDLQEVHYFYAERVMYAGIATTVGARLEELGYKVAYEHPTVQKKYDWARMFKYRPLQSEMVAAAIEHRFARVEAPPGYGKTRVAGSIIADLGLRAVMITEKGEPFDQAYNTFSNPDNFDLGNVGRLSGRHKDVQPVTVAGVQTLLKIEDTSHPIYQAEVVIVDECHHAGALSYEKVLNRFTKAKFVIGVSATPERVDTRADWLLPLIGPVVYRIEYSTAIDLGILCPMTVYAKTIAPVEYGYIVVKKDAFGETFVEKDPDPVVRMSQYQDVYSDYIMYNDERNTEIAKFTRQAVRQGLTVAIVVARIEHAEEIQTYLPDAVILHGGIKTKMRQQIVEDLRTHRIKVVISTLFDEAVDVPSLGAVVLAAGGKSPIKLKQRLRSLRTFDGTLHDGSRYKKTRGYVFVPLDQADFLTSHTRASMKMLTELVQSHPENVLIHK